jgi:hypothetical protein
MKDEMTIFHRNALLANLCKEWATMWSNCHDDKEKLMRLVLMQQSAPYFATFCYNGAGLSKEYCLKEFGDYLNGRTFANCDGVEGFTYAMYISPSEAVKMSVDVAQILWSNPAEVIIPETKCPRLYVSNKSSVHLTLEGYNSVLVYLFDESELIIDDADDTCEVVVYRYSDKSKVERGTFCISPKVKIFNKTLKL